MCGIVGIVGQVAGQSALYDALTVLQHRGQDAAGIMTATTASCACTRATAWCATCSSERHMLQPRAATSASATAAIRPRAAKVPREAQPFYVNSPYGIALAHNGNLINADALRRESSKHDRRHVNTDSDSEVLLNVFAHELREPARSALTPGRIFTAVDGASSRAASAATRSCRMMLGYGLLAFRDPHGIRPLVLGARETPHGDEYMVASESVALDVARLRAACATSRRARRCSSTSAASCYCAAVRAAPRATRRASSSTSTSRAPTRSSTTSRCTRRACAWARSSREKILRVRPDHDIDVVIPIPDTSRTAALQVAQRARREVPRRLRQEPLHRPHVHHAGPGASA